MNFKRENVSNNSSRAFLQNSPKALKIAIIKNSMKALQMRKHSLSSHLSPL
jgi:hypothetical protein